VLVGAAVAQAPIWGRRLAVVGACTIVTGSIVALGARDLQDNRDHFPTESSSRQLLAFADAHRLRYGYGDYWDAAPVTWQTKARLQVFPVAGCEQSHAVCPFPVNRIGDWYRPRAHTRTFLLIDPDHLAIVDPLVKTLGRPALVGQVGRFRILVYPYDIASRFGRN